MDLRARAAQYLTLLPSNVFVDEPFIDGRVICLDTETTGFGADAQIIEIAAVEVVDGRRTGALFHSYCRLEVGKEINYMAERCHGLNAAALARQPPVEQVIRNFLHFVGNTAQVVAHVASFDVRLIQQHAQRLLLRTPDFRIFCTHRYAGAHLKHVLSSRKLDSLAEHYRVDTRLLDKRTVHGALVDTEILTAVYEEMCVLSEMIDSVTADVRKQQPLGQSPSLHDGDDNDENDDDDHHHNGDNVDGFTPANQDAMSD
jgi:DNA polymerase III epsilon subunit family exonuclease